MAGEIIRVIRGLLIAEVSLAAVIVAVLSIVFVVRYVFRVPHPRRSSSARVASRRTR